MRDNGSLVWLQTQVPISGFAFPNFMRKSPAEKWVEATEVKVKGVIGPKIQVPLHMIPEPVMQSFLNPLDAPAVLPWDENSVSTSWKKFWRMSTPVFDFLKPWDTLDGPEGNVTITRWILYPRHQVNNGVTVWANFNAKDIPKIMDPTQGWTDPQIPLTTNQVLALMASPDKKVRILTPSARSMNKLLLGMVQYQAKKSALRFWSDIKRANLDPANFSQEWFSTWKTNEIGKMTLDYVFGVFKRFVRSAMATEGMAVTRTFPKLLMVEGKACFEPLEVSYPEWTDPAGVFRDLATFTEPDMSDLWIGVENTAMDLILEVCANFEAFMEWFMASVSESLDQIRESALLMNELQEKFQWIEKLDFKVG